MIEVGLYSTIVWDSKVHLKGPISIAPLTVSGVSISVSTTNPKKLNCFVSAAQKMPQKRASTSESEDQNL